MKYKIIKIVALLIIIAHLSSCYTRVRTDRAYPARHKYRRAGNYW